jgi:hypothetical protein
MPKLTPVGPDQARPKPPPRPPAGLGVQGRALWARITKALVLDPGEYPLLSAACHQADKMASLEACIRRDGATVRGSKGQPRLNPAIAEVRQGRLAMARLLSGISMPNEAGAPQTIRQTRAKHAADVRWSRNGRA